MLQEDPFYIHKKNNKTDYTSRNNTLNKTPKRHWKIKIHIIIQIIFFYF